MVQREDENLKGSGKLPPGPAPTEGEDVTYWTRAFWAALAERALRTFAQSFAALIAVDATTPANIHWLNALAIAGVATLLSVLTSIAGNVATKNGPSFTNAEQVVPPEPQPKHEDPETAGGITYGH